MTNNLKSTLYHIDQLVEDLQILPPIDSENKGKLEKKFRLEFNYNSNHIEGNTLTYGETVLLLIFDDTKGNHNYREYEEMKAHDVAYQLIQDWAKDTKQPFLVEQDVKDLNKILLVRPFWKEAVIAEGQNTRRLIKVGDYKEHPNSVRLQNGEMFHYASPMETPIKMNELMTWFRAEEEKKELHPVALAALLHYKFVLIHPFDDGNGRISRLLMNYVLLKNNLLPIIIKSADKRNYLSALNSADTGDINTFVQYIAEQLIWSLGVSIKATKGQNIEEADDLDKEISVFKKELGTKNVLDVKATTQNILEAIHDNIMPLFIETEERINEFKEFFFDFERRIEFDQNIDDKSHHRLGNKNNVLKVVLLNWLNSGKFNDDSKIQKIDYDYELKGFKKNISAPNFSIGFKIYFNEFNYIIENKRERNNYKTFPYNQKLNKETINSFVTPAIKTLIEDIKRANGN